MENLSNEENDTILAEARQEALNEARKHGLQIGTVVGFHDLRDRMSYKLLEIKGDTAVIGYGEVRKKASLQNLVDVNRVKEIALEIMTTGKHIRPEQLN